MAVRRHPLPFMEDIMALERPSFSLELQYPHKPGHSSIWSEYGTYRSFDHAMEKAGACHARPCRIVEHRVVWRSISKIGRASCWERECQYVYSLVVAGTLNHTHTEIL